MRYYFTLVTLSSVLGIVVCRQWGCFVYFWLRWVFVAAHGVSLVAVRRLQ